MLAKVQSLVGTHRNRRGERSNQTRFTDSQMPPALGILTGRRKGCNKAAESRVERPEPRVGKLPLLRTPNSRLSTPNIENSLVGRRRKKRSNTPVLGNHQRCWLWGRHAVLETLRARRWKPLEIFVDPFQLDFATRGEVTTLAESLKVPLRDSDSETLDRYCGRNEHQGLLARMPDYPYADAAPLLKQLTDRSFVLLLDRIQDPFNFGAILRSAEIFGVNAVFVPNREQARVSVHVARSSSGAINHIAIAEVESLSEAVQALKERGLKIVGASEKAEREPACSDFTHGVAVIIGNEGAGPNEELLSLCDEQLRIPQSGQVGSLNAAVAAGIFCYEVARQRSASTSAQ